MKGSAAFVPLIAAMVLLGSVIAVTAINGSEQGSGSSEVVDQFLELSKVPRCSGNNAKMGAYLLDFAEKNGLRGEIDAVGNVMIDHPGKIDGSIILQAHQDMVPVCDIGMTHNFLTDPLNVTVKDGIITATGTTLGADDGAGIAICLCALKDPSLKDVRFRCIFTVDEETTQIGIENVSVGWISGFRYFLNLDNEDENTVFVGSAGAITNNITYSPVLSGTERECYTLTVSGLKGGHSGVMIDKGRANAILLAVGFVEYLDGAVISFISGGELINSIPNSCTVGFAWDGDVSKALGEYRDIVTEEYSAADPDITLTLESAGSRSVWTEASTGDFIGAIASLDKGVIKKDEYGVITSGNVGIVRTVGSSVKLDISYRSALDADLTACYEKAAAAFRAIGGGSEMGMRMSGWLEEKDTPLSQRVVSVMGEVFGTRASVEVIHAGLECGTVKSKVPEIQIASVGPTVKGAHTTSESVSVESLEKTWTVVHTLLKEGI